MGRRICITIEETPDREQRQPPRDDRAADIRITPAEYEKLREEQERKGEQWKQSQDLPR